MPKANLLIEVNWADIINGIKGNCWRCPLALAITRQIKGKVLVEIGPGLSAINDNNFSHDSKVSRWIINFDLSQSGSPFTFEINYKLQAFIWKSSTVTSDGLSLSKEKSST